MRMGGNEKHVSTNHPDLENSTSCDMTLDKTAQNQPPLFKVPVSFDSKFAVFKRL